MIEPLLRWLYSTINPCLKNPLYFVARSRDRIDNRIAHDLLLSRTPVCDKKMLTLVPTFNILNRKWEKIISELWRTAKQDCIWLARFESVKLFTAGPYTIYVWEIGFDNLYFFRKKNIILLWAYFQIYAVFDLQSSTLTCETRDILSTLRSQYCIVFLFESPVNFFYIIHHIGFQWTSNFRANLV